MTTDHDMPRWLRLEMERSKEAEEALALIYLQLKGAGDVEAADTPD